MFIHQIKINYQCEFNEETKRKVLKRLEISGVKIQYSEKTKQKEPTEKWSIKDLLQQIGLKRKERSKKRSA